MTISVIQKINAKPSINLKLQSMTKDRYRQHHPATSHHINIYVRCFVNGVLNFDFLSFHFIDLGSQILYLIFKCMVLTFQLKRLLCPMVLFFILQCKCFYMFSVVNGIIWPRGLDPSLFQLSHKSYLKELG